MLAVGDKIFYNWMGIVFPCKIKSIDIVRGTPIKDSGNGHYSMRTYELVCKITATLPNEEIVMGDIGEFTINI